MNIGFCFRIVTGTQHDRNKELVMSRPLVFRPTGCEFRLEILNRIIPRSSKNDKTCTADVGARCCDGVN
jgi:hypothetical protein